MSGVEIRPEAPDSAAARACVDAYFAELAARFPGGFDPGVKGYGAAGDGGVFLLARDRGRTVGCGAVRTIAAGTAEIKRMWVAPEARGRGLGRTLLAALEAEAVKLGARRAVLDTHASLSEARALYAAAGYREIPRYNDNPYAQLWFEKSLSAG